METIQNAITLAETGHLVFATLHTKNVAEAVDRMIDVFPSGQQQSRYAFSYRMFWRYSQSASFALREWWACAGLRGNDC